MEVNIQNLTVSLRKLNKHWWTQEIEMKVFKLLATLIQRQGNQSHIKQHGKKNHNSDKSYGHGDKRQNK
jgi:hypothetical protein